MSDPVDDDNDPSAILPAIIFLCTRAEKLGLELTEHLLGAALEAARDEVFDNDADRPSLH